MNTVSDKGAPTHRKDDSAGDSLAPTDVLAPAAEEPTAVAAPVGPGMEAALPAFARDDADEARQADELPNFTLPAESDETGAGMTREHAETFADLSDREHVNNLISFVLILLAPAALFTTLWWPFGVDAPHFAEANPTMSTVVGLAAALALIVAGLIVHFAPRGRHEVLSAIEAGELAPSEESHGIAEDKHATKRSSMRVLQVLGALALTAAVVFAALALLALGNAGTVFGWAALAFVAIAAGFGFLYVPFTHRRTVNHLSL